MASQDPRSPCETAFCSVSRLNTVSSERGYLRAIVYGRSTISLTGRASVGVGGGVSVAGGVDVELGIGVSVAVGVAVALGGWVGVTVTGRAGSGLFVAAGTVRGWPWRAQGA